VKVKLKVEKKWFDIERDSMTRMQRSYAKWEQEMLKKAREATDMTVLRELFYQLGDRWEFDQATGAWLNEGDPLDAVGVVLRMPGFSEGRERFVLYVFMAYSKGLTRQFDHLGDKERVILELDTRTGQLLCWSTSGHGSIDLYPIDLTGLGSVEKALSTCHLVAQPGDHALRVECPECTGLLNSALAHLWMIAGGTDEFSLKSIDVLIADDIERVLDFRFHRYAQAVLKLERAWRKLSFSTASRAKEAVLDNIPDHIEARNKRTIRQIEGLLHVLWFSPPSNQMRAVKNMYEELQSEPTPTEVQEALVPYIGELLYSLNDIVEKAKYLKWKSVIDRKSFSESELFRGLDLSPLAQQAFAAALEDILKEHSLAYIGYPERATMKYKFMRVFLGFSVLPLRLYSSFKVAALGALFRFLNWLGIGRRVASSQSDTEDENVTGGPR
jgi:hypothetical protein